MPEIKSLNDFYDPTKAGIAAMNIMQQQDVLALHERQAQQQQANQEIDNKRQAAQLAITENPAGAAAAYNDYAQSIGAPQVKDANAFTANPQPFWDQLNYPPDSKEFLAASAKINSMGVSTQKRSMAEFQRQGAIRGAGQLLAATGGQATPEMSAFMAGSDELQREASKSYFDPSRAAKEQANKEHMGQVAEIHGELKPLIDLGFQSRDQLEALAKITPKVAAAQAKYEKDLASNKGMAHAAGARGEALAGDPDVAKYLTDATASIPKIEAQLSQITTARQATRREAAHLAAGTKVQSIDASYETLIGTARYQDLHKQYLEAQLALAKDPMNPAKHQAVAQVAQAMTVRAAELHQSRTSLDARHDELLEKQRVAGIAERKANAISQGQRMIGVLPEEQQTTQAAARIAEQLKQSTGTDVNVEDILIKKPNIPGVRVDIGDKTADIEYIKSTRVTFDQLKQTQGLLDNIEKTKALIPKAKGFMGPGGETLLDAAKFLNNRLGTNINVAGIKSAEEVRTRIFFNLMDNLKKVDAQPSQMQQLIMQDSLGKLGTDPNALGDMLDAYGDALRSKVEEHNLEVRGAEKRGTHFPFDPVIKLRPKDEMAPAAPSTMTPGVPQFHDPEKQKRYDKWKQEHKP